MQISKFNSNDLRALKEGSIAIYLNDKDSTPNNIRATFKRAEGVCKVKPGLLVFNINSSISIVQVECVVPMGAKCKPGPLTRATIKQIKRDRT